MSSRLRPLAPIALLAAIAWLSAGAGSCSQRQPPQLIRVSDVAPADVELGDRVVISGEGFPAGRQARVTFRGELRRPGERPVRGAEIVLPGTAVGPGQVEVPFGEAAQAAFCGAGDRAAHTTFEGEVEVAFAAAAAGAPPVAGTLPQATVDVLPGASPRDDERDREGARLAAFVGLRVGAARRGLGLPVTGVDPGSRAAAAGIAAGDVVATFDGLRVDSAGDLVPPPGEHEATLGVRADGASVTTPRALPVDGFRRPAAVEMLASALLVAGALALALLFGAPLRPSAASALHRIASRVRARAATARSGRGGEGPAWGPALRALLAAAARDVLPPAAAPAIADVATCALLAAMPFGQYLVASRLDVGLLFVAAAGALAAAALAARGSALAGARAAAHVAWQHVPAAVALASVVLTAGSLRIQEIEHAQGGLPWDWLAFRSPAALIALALLLGCGAIDPEAPGPAAGIARYAEDVAAPPRAAGRRRWVDAAGRAHRVVVAALASALFLGGWSLPGLSPAQQDARPALEAAGALLWLAKTGALCAGLSLARWGLPAASLAERSRATAAWRVPLSLVAFAATAAWTWWSPGHAAQVLVSASLVLASSVAAAGVAQRVGHGVLAPGAEGRLSTFL